MTSTANLTYVHEERQLGEANYKMDTKKTQQTRFHTAAKAPLTLALNLGSRVRELSALPLSDLHSQLL